MPRGARRKPLPPGAELGNAQPVDLDVAECTGDVLEAVAERLDRRILGDVLLEVFVDELGDGQLAAGERSEAYLVELVLQHRARLTLRLVARDLVAVAVGVVEAIRPGSTVAPEHLATLQPHLYSSVRFASTTDFRLLWASRVVR
jgi:hypothetical protein